MTRTINTTNDILEQKEIAWMIENAEMQVTNDENGNDYQIKDSLFFDGKVNKRMFDGIIAICKAAQKNGVGRGHTMEVCWDNGGETAEEYMNYIVKVYAKSKSELFARLIITPGAFVPA